MGMGYAGDRQEDPHTGSKGTRGARGADSLSGMRYALDITRRLAREKLRQEMIAVNPPLVTLTYRLGPARGIGS